MTPRRKFLQSSVGSAVAALASCERVGSDSKGMILRVCCWNNFFAPETIKSFELKHACNVDLVNFETNEELFTRLDSNNANVDIVTPSSYFVPVLAEAGLLKEVGDVVQSRSIHAPGLSDAAPMPPQMVPYVWSVSGILSLGDVDRSSISWDMFSNRSFLKKFSLLEDVREVLGSALKLTKSSANSTSRDAIHRAREVATTWVKSCLYMANTQYTIGLEAGEILLAHGYNADAWHASRANSKLGFHVPAEGGLVSIDGFAISAKSPNNGLAADFIRHMHLEENVVANMNWSGLLSLDKAALDRATSLKDFVFASNHEGMRKSEILMDVGNDIDVMNDIWQSILESR